MNEQIKINGVKSAEDFKEQAAIVLHARASSIIKPQDRFAEMLAATWNAAFLAGRQHPELPEGLPTIRQILNELDSSQFKRQVLSKVLLAYYRQGAATATALATANGSGYGL